MILGAASPRLLQEEALRSGTGTKCRPIYSQPSDRLTAHNQNRQSGAKARI
jgi:hypothetical protein